MALPAQLGRKVVMTETLVAPEPSEDEAPEGCTVRVAG